MYAWETWYLADFDTKMAIILGKHMICNLSQILTEKLVFNCCGLIRALLKCFRKENESGREKGNFHKKYEPPHDKTNKMAVCPAKTRISLGIHPV